MRDAIRRPVWSDRRFPRSLVGRSRIGPCSTSAPVIPEPVRKLVVEQIGSIEQLEVLLLLRAHGDRAWSVQGINDSVRSSQSSVKTRLEALIDGGFVTRTGGLYRYRAPPQLDALVGALASAYAERRFTIIELIFSKTDKKGSTRAR